MLFIAFLILLFLTVLGFYLIRDVFSPFVIVPGVWFAILLLFYIAHPDFYPICHDFPFAVSIWTFGFLITGYLVYYYLPENRSLFSCESNTVPRNMEPSSMMIKVYTIISVVIIPYMLYSLIRFGLNRGESNLLLYIRLSNVGVEGIEKPNFGLIEYALPLPTILLALVLTYSKKKYMKWLVIIINILTGMISMSKTSFFITLCVIFYVLYKQKKIKLRAIGIGFAIFLGLSVIFQLLRATNSQKASFSSTNMMSLYILSPCVAFDYYAKPNSSTFTGEHVFRFYYALMHGLGSDIEPAPNIHKFVGVPELTNTYTILYPFYTDFGIPGIFIFSLFYGAIFAFLYKRSEHGKNIYFIVYACFINYLILEFVQENFFSNFSLNMQILFFIWLAFAANGDTGLMKKTKKIISRKR